MQLIPSRGAGKDLPQVQDGMHYTYVEWHVEGVPLPDFWRLFLSLARIILLFIRRKNQKTPTAPIDESMIPSSLTRPSLMDPLLIHSNRDEIQGSSSGKWLLKLKREIKNPDQPRKTLFDDSNEKDFLERLTSDTSRMYSFAEDGASESAAGSADTRISASVQVAASASAAGHGDMELSRLASMAPAKSVAEQFPLVDIDREQSREFACRELSLFAARPSAASRPPQDALITDTCKNHTTLSYTMYPKEESKPPTAAIDESMIPSSSSRPSLMDDLLIRSYRDEIQGFSSGPWIVELKEEIDIPDQPHPSVFDYFDDYDGEGLARQYSIAQVGASESAAAAAASAATPATAATTTKAKATATATATATPTPDKAKAKASRKRKVTSKKPVKRRKRALKDPVPQRAPSPNDDRFVGEEDIRDDDILGGRGGLANNHVGNRKFRKIITDMKGRYRRTGVKTDKTALSRAIVEDVHEKGGRFLIKNKGGPAGWRFMTKEETQRKTSQALREKKEPKWTI